MLRNNLICLEQKFICRCTFKAVNPERMQLHEVPRNNAAKGVAAVAASLRLLLRDAGGPGRAGLMVGLDDLRGFSQP